jgi:hypothetical protein
LTLAFRNQVLNKIEIHFVLNMKKGQKAKGVYTVNLMEKKRMDSVVVVCKTGVLADVPPR